MSRKRRETVHVFFLMAGTVAEHVHTAERITTQRLPDGGARIVLWNRGRRSRALTYGQLAFINHTFDPPSKGKP